MEIEVSIGLCPLNFRNKEFRSRIDSVCGCERNMTAIRLLGNLEYFASRKTGRIVPVTRARMLQFPSMDPTLKHERRSKRLK